MEFVRKLYMPDGQSGGGPSDEDINKARRLREVYDQMENTLRSIADIFKQDLNESTQDMDRNTQKIIASYGRELKSVLIDASKRAKTLGDAQNNYTKKLNTEAKVRNEINRVADNRYRIDSLAAQIQSEIGQLTAEQVEMLERITEELNTQEAILNKRLKTAIKIDKQMESFKDLMTGISRIPILGPLIGAPKILREMEKSAEKGASRLKQFGVGLDQLFKNIGSGLILGAITTFLTFIVRAVLDFDKKSFEIAKNLGVTASKAKELQGTFQAIAMSSGNIALTSSQVARTYEDISNTAGFLMPTNKNLLETATLLQKQLGLSGDQLNAIATQAALSGKTFRQSFRLIEGTRVVEGARNKLALSSRQVFDAISKTSASILVNFKGSETALTAAVIRAAKLGTTLEQVNKQADALVDFESSIQAEFEAQVLTGRDMNLTRARELANLEKTAELMEELKKQGIELAQFEKLTRIEKDAFAKAIGLSREELSKQLIEQEKAKKLGAEQGVSLQEQYKKLLASKKTREEIATLIGKDAEADLNKASMAEKFNATMERLKDTLGSILMGPVGGMIEQFTRFVNDGEKMRKLGEALKGIFEKIQSVVKSLPQYLSTAVQVAKVLASVSIARAVASIVGSLSTIPIVGAAAGLYAGYQAYNWLNGLLAGVGGGAPSISTPSAPTTGVSPMNPATEAAKSSSESAAAAENKPPVFNFNVTAQIGNENISRLTRTSIQQDPGANMV